MRAFLFIVMALIVGTVVYRILNPSPPITVEFTEADLVRMQKEVSQPEEKFWLLAAGNVVVCGKGRCRFSSYAPSDIPLTEVEKDITKVKVWLTIQEKHLNSWQIAREKSKTSGHPESVIGFVECNPTGCKLQLPSSPS